MKNSTYILLQSGTFEEFIQVVVESSLSRKFTTSPCGDWYTAKLITFFRSFQRSGTDLKVFFNVGFEWYQLNIKRYCGKYAKSTPDKFRLTVDIKL